MIIVVISLTYLSYKLCTGHILTSIVVVKSFVSTSIRFVSNSNVFSHDKNPFCDTHKQPDSILLQIC
nr:MAG TPA: hypothetical protein [Caudoviricetes sp.]DAY63938.1 MAG TPA: hypothetical protein [Caudoviricetes sp.]